MHRKGQPEPKGPNRAYARGGTRSNKEQHFGDTDAGRKGNRDARKVFQARGQVVGETHAPQGHRQAVQLAADEDVRDGDDHHVELGVPGDDHEQGLRVAREPDVVLHEVRLQGDLAQRVQRLHVPRTHQGAQIPHVDVRQHGHCYTEVGVFLVVLQLFHLDGIKSEGGGHTHV